MIWLLLVAFLASLSASAPVSAQAVGGPGGNPNNPIAPNQPCSDDSDRIANTHFVHNCGGGTGGGTIPLGLGFTITPGQDNPSAGALATPLVIGTNTLYGQIDPLPFFVDTPITAAMMGHNVKAMAGVSILFTLGQAGTTGFEKGVSVCFVASGAGGLTLTAAGGSLIHGVPVSSNIMTSGQYGNGCAASDGTDWDVSWTFPSGTGSVTSISAGSHITLTPNPIVSTGTVAFSQMATNTVVANPTSGTANAQDLAVPSCSADHDALQWLTNTGFQCPTDFAQFDKNQTWTENQAMPPVILTDGATINTNGLLRNYFKVTLTGNNHTLADPTNVQPGNYTWFIYTGAGFTGFTTGSSFKWVGGTPVWSTAAGKEDVISCLVDDTLTMACFAGIDAGGSGGGLSLTSAHIYVGNSSNIATDVAVSGVLTLANTGAFSFASSTGSGAVVLATSPTISGLTVTGSLTATGLVTNADLVNSAATVNGQTCTLGSSCTVTAAATSLTVGMTTIASGTSGRLLFDNAGVLGEPTMTASSGALTLGSTTGPVAGSVTMWGSTSGSLQVKPAAAAGTSSVLTLPGGTTDFSATGGTSQVVKQVSAGAAFTVARLACADLSDSSTGCSGAASATGANPSASVGLTAVNGSAATFTRSDGAPALSQSISPTWTGTHIFTNSLLKLLGSSTGAHTFTSSNAGSSNYTLTIPANSLTLAAIDVADQTITGGANITSLSQSTGNITVDCGSRPSQYITNGGAFTITAPSNDGSCYLDVENNGSAGTITLSGFSPNTMGGATLDTTNGHNFRLVVTRVHAHSNIFAIALQ